MENNYRKLVEEISVPKELENRVLRAAQRQRAEAASAKRQAKGRWRPVLRGAACAACALALVRGSVHFRPAEKSGDQPGNTPVVALDYSFGLTACAAETGETVRPNANGGLALLCGSGVADGENGDFTGCLFRVTGDNIKTVSLSIDRGGFYRSQILTGLTDEEVQELWQAEEVGGPVCSVYGEDEDGPMNAEVMTALGASVTEGYAPEARYGFWVPPEEMVTDDTLDMREQFWANIDTFDGARLTVTVTFADGGEESKTYTLSTGKLRMEYDEYGMRNVLPQLAGDEEAFAYGIYAASETESRWLRWPVQDSRTVWKGNPYGVINGKLHSGIDIPADQGAVILAAADGTVTEVGFDREKGNYLALDHGDGLTTVYAHCRNVDVQKGDTVKAGEMVAAVGSTGMSTGPHLHFEVRQDGQAQNPVVYIDSGIRETLKME